MNISTFDFSMVRDTDYIMIPMGTFAHEAHSEETFSITLHICGFDDAAGDLDYEVMVANDAGYDMRKYLDDADFINPLEWALRAVTRDDTLFVSKGESGAQHEDCASFDLLRK